MATEKKYLSYDMLSLYDSKMKEHVAGGDAATLAEAKTYAEELGDNYDASGSAATAESNANKYTDEQLATEKARAEAAEANLQEQINSVSNSANLEEIVNSINGFNEYMTEHGEVTEGFRTAIDANTQAIETLEETLADGVAVSWNDLTDKPFGIGETLHLQSEFILNADSPSHSFYPVGVLVNRKKQWNDGDELVFVIDDTAELRVPQSGTEPTMGGSVVYDDVKFRISEFKLARVSSGTLWSAEFTATDLTGDGLSKSYTVNARYVTSKVNALDPKFLPEEAQPDWNQNDEDAPNYVKNRPFYYSVVPNENAVVYEQTFTIDELTLSEGGYETRGTYKINVAAPGVIDDRIYTITVDGVTYENVHAYKTSDTMSYLGDYSYTNYPFWFNYATNSTMSCGFLDNGSDNHSIRVVANISAKYAKMDEGFLPESVAKTTLRSTTEESTKKFDVTVDDEGNLSTTDVETGETKVIGSGSGGGGVTSWNDLEDKPFYEESNIVVLYETSLEATSDELVTLNNFIPLELGKRYTVVYDDVTYDLTSFDHDSTPDYIFLGDPDLSTSDDLPFSLGCSLDGTNADIFVRGGSHTLKIYVGSSEIHKIDIKYLPDEVISVQSDWNEDNPSSPAYVRNRPFYNIPTHRDLTAYENETLLFNNYNTIQTTSDNGDTVYGQSLYWIGRGVAGETYEVVLDGQSYFLECYDGPADSNLHSYLSSDGTLNYDTNEIIVTWNTSMQTYVWTKQPSDHQFSMYRCTGYILFSGTGVNGNVTYTTYDYRSANSDYTYTVLYNGEIYKNLPFVDGYRDNIGYPGDMPFEIWLNGSQIWFTLPDDANANISIIGTNGVFVKMDERYLPESVGEIVMREESGSTFKLTIDGAGKMSATNLDTGLTRSIGVHSDWLVDDITSAKHIQHRPFFGDDYGEPILIYSAEIDINKAVGVNGAYLSFMTIPDMAAFKPESSYTVKYNDVEYKNLMSYVDGETVYIGNKDLSFKEGDIPFVLSSDINVDGEFTFRVKEHRWYTLEIYDNNSNLHTLDPKFLPMDDITTAVLSALPTWTGGSY